MQARRGGSLRRGRWNRTCWPVGGGKAGAPGTPGRQGGRRAQEFSQTPPKKKFSMSPIRSRSLGGSFYQAGVTFADEVVEKRGKQFGLFDQLRDFLLGRDLCSQVIRQISL